MNARGLGGHDSQVRTLRSVASGIRVALPGLGVACLALALCALEPGPARAASLWGYSGLGLLPSGDVLRPGEYSTGAHVAAFGGDTANPFHVVLPMHLSLGLLEGLEATLMYPGRNSGATNISGGLALQLVKATRENPIRVSLGLTNLGTPRVPAGRANSDSFVSANNLFMVLSRDFNMMVGGQSRTLLVGYFGFNGAIPGFPFVNMDSRVMLGAEVPVREYGSAYVEYLGPSSSNPRGQFFNLGVRYQPASGLDIDVASLGLPGLEPWERAYVIGVAYRGQWPALLSASNQLSNQLASHLKPTSEASPAGLSAPPTATSSAPAAPVAPASASRLPPVPAVAPPPAPLATIYGRVTTPSGAPIANTQVGILELMQWRSTTHSGAYFVPSVPRGVYTLAVQDTGGRVIASRSIEVPGNAPIQADLQVQAAGHAASPGTLE